MIRGYKEGSNIWRRCASISVDNTGGSASTIDFTVTLPVAWDEFWEAIDTSGDGIRVVGPDGSLLAYSLSGWSRTNRTGTLSVDGYAAPAAGMLQVLLYWSPDTTASSAAVATTISAAKSAYIEVCGPARGTRVVRSDEQLVGATAPRTKYQKGSEETVDLWFDLGPSLPGRLRPYAEDFGCDVPAYANYTVTTGGASQTSMRSLSTMRWYDGRYLRCRVAAGASGTNYTIQPVITTAEGLTLAPRAYVAVRDQNET